MQPILYPVNGLWQQGRYLLGAYRWAYPVRLEAANLTVRPPASGSLTLTLEVGGSLTDVAFTVGSGAGSDEVSLDRDVAVLVPANQWVRWLVTASTVPEEDAASFGSVTVQPYAQSVTQASVPASVYQVGWVEGVSGRVIVFGYDPATHTFTGTSAAAGRAAFVNNGPDASLSVRIGAAEVLRVAAGEIRCNEFFALGSVATAEVPRLEFLVDGARVATLSATGALRVAQVTEDPASLAGLGGFQFYSGGALTAVLAKTGLYAAAIQEPLS